MYTENVFRLVEDMLAKQICILAATLEKCETIQITKPQARQVFVHVR